MKAKAARLAAKLITSRIIQEHALYISNSHIQESVGKELLSNAKKMANGIDVVGVSDTDLVLEAIRATGDENHELSSPGLFT